MAVLQHQNLKQLWQNPALQKLHGAFAAQKAELRLVGGCVRDALLGLAPHDFDLATTAKPADMLGWLKAANIKALPTGLAHGTITAVIKGQHFQITTLRADVVGHGRHATVAFGASWQDDAARRDFTINALSCSFDGQLHDYFGGVDDLATGHVRFVGEAATRLDEDYLRLLRYVRFWLRFDGVSNWPEALKDAAPKIVQLSRERVREEWFKILQHKNVLDVLPKLQTIKLDKYLDAYVWHIDALQNLLVVNPQASLWARLAALYGTQDLRAVYKLSRDESKRLNFLTLQPHLHDDTIEIYKLLYHHPKSLIKDLANLQAIKAANIIDNYIRPTFPITGQDLLAAGVPQGPQMKALQNQLLDWFLNFAPDYPDRAACLVQLKEKNI